MTSHGATEVLEDRPGGGIVCRTVLPAGLRMITESIPGTRSAAVGLWVDVGSRDETLLTAGAAHYLEHLLFKGTKRRSATQIAEEMDAVGGELNAFTAKEHTCYYAHVLDQDLPLAVDLVCDVLGNALIEQSEMDLERQVILEEIAMRGDDPEDLLAEEFAAALFGSSELGRSVLGTAESIASMPRDALHEFYREWYTPHRMVLSVTGNVEHGAVLDALEASFAEHLLQAATPAPVRSGTETITGNRRLAVYHDQSEQTHLMLGVPGLARRDERRYALDVLDAALGGGISSRLFQQVREQRGLAYQVYSSASRYSSTGSLAIYAGCAHERLGEVTGVVREILGDIASDGLRAAEVTRSQGQLRGNLVLGLEDPASRMARLGRIELGSSGYLSIEEIIRRIDAVTAEQVAALAAELLDAPITAAIVGPYADLDELPTQIHEVIA